MPQKDKQLSHYIQKVAEDDFRQHPDYATLINKGRNAHFIARKRSAGNPLPKQKYLNLWHVKRTDDRYPLDPLANIVMHALFPHIVQQTQFKIRCWFDQNKGHFLVASKHVEGFIPWRHARSKMMLSILGNVMYYNHKPIRGYGYLHVLSYLIANIDLHSYNFGIAPIYREDRLSPSGQTVDYYQVILIDYDHCFHRSKLSRAILPEHFNVAGLPRMPLNAKENFEVSNTFETLEIVQIEHAEAYCRLLANCFTDYQEMAASCCPPTSNSKSALVKLEDRRKQMLTIALTKPAILQHCQRWILTLLEQEDYAALEKIISANNIATCQQLFQHTVSVHDFKFIRHLLQKPTESVFEKAKTLNCYLLKSLATAIQNDPTITACLFEHYLPIDFALLLLHFDDKSHHLANATIALCSQAMLIDIFKNRLALYPDPVRIKIREKFISLPRQAQIDIILYHYSCLPYTVSNIHQQVTLHHEAVKIIAPLLNQITSFETLLQLYVGVTEKRPQQPDIDVMLTMIYQRYIGLINNSEAIHAQSQALIQFAVRRPDIFFKSAEFATFRQHEHATSVYLNRISQLVQSNNIDELRHLLSTISVGQHTHLLACMTDGSEVKMICYYLHPDMSQAFDYLNRLALPAQIQALSIASQLFTPDVTSSICINRLWHWLRLSCLSDDAFFAVNNTIAEDHRAEFLQILFTETQLLTLSAIVLQHIFYHHRRLITPMQSAHILCVLYDKGIDISAHIGFIVNYSACLTIGKHIHQRSGNISDNIRTALHHQIETNATPGYVYTVGLFTPNQQKAKHPSFRILTNSEAFDDQLAREKISHKPKKARISHQP